MQMLGKSNILIILVFLIGSVFTSYGQQDPNYTQYMYNMSIINPGYATNNNEQINFGLLYRSQWVGAVGAPSTGTFFAHSTITDRLEGGISVFHDQIGDVVKDTNLFVDIAYVIPVSPNSNLSFGLKAGVSFYSTNFNDFVYSDAIPDPTFAENINRTFPNIGLGAFYFSNNYYLGFSIPSLLKSKYIDDSNGIYTSGSEELHMYLTGGYVFNLNENLKLKPAFMAIGVNGAPVSFDLTANMLINNFVEFGLGYRFGDGISGLANFKVSPAIRIGYAYDYTISNLGNYNSGTHEIILLLNLSKFSSGYDKSPRFF